jgi:hypothetical protein
MDDTGRAAYARQSRWSDPGAFVDAFDTAPGAPEALAETISGLILHPGLAGSRGFPVPDHARADPDLRPLSDLLAALLSRSPSPLSEKRAPAQRVFAVCRHYALMAAGILRHHGTPARVRVGFANYFTPGWAEDHWVCEYLAGGEWRLLDPELGATTARQMGIIFPAHDVPRDRFISAARAWISIRSGALDPARVGLSSLGIAGDWFVAGSLLRDAAALLMQEMQPWDVWGPTRDLEQGRAIEPEWLERFDDLARALDREPDDMAAARAIVAVRPWAGLTDTILSYRLEPVEVRLA